MPAGSRNDRTVLDEHPAAVGMGLWRLLCDTRLWGACDDPGPAFFRVPASVVDACEAAARAAPEIAEPIAVLLRLVRDPRPERRAEAAAACRAIAAWAAARRAPETALQFAETAAVVLPDDACACADAGKAAAQRAEHVRAIAWYQRALVLARRSNDWKCYVRTLLRHGAVLVDTGRLELAKPLFERAWRTARRKGYKELAAFAQHDLFMAAGLAGDWKAAQFHGVRALELYPVFNRHVPRFANDVARMLLLLGLPARARSVLLRAEEVWNDRSQALFGGALLVLASARCGDRGAYSDQRSSLLAHLQDDEEFAAIALVFLAEAAAAFAAWDEGDALIARAVRISRRLENAADLELATDVQARLSERRIGAWPRNTHDSDELQYFIRSLLRRLRRQASSAHRLGGPQGDVGAQGSSKTEPEPMNPPPSSVRHCSGADPDVL